MPPHQNNAFLNLSEETRLQARKTIRSMVNSLSFFEERLAGKPTRDDAVTHISLLESDYKQLSDLLDIKNVTADSLRNRDTMLKDAYRKIEQLQGELTQHTSASTIEAKLRQYADTISLFYHALGFGYASIEFGLSTAVVKFYATLEYHVRNKTKNLLEKQFQTHYSLITSSDSLYDIERGDNHAELLDTDMNKKFIAKLFQTEFPDSYIIEYHSRPNDFGTFSLFSLDFTVRIPYHDLDVMRERIQSEIPQSDHTDKTE